MEKSEGLFYKYRDIYNFPYFFQILVYAFYFNIKCITLKFKIRKAKAYYFALEEWVSILHNKMLPMLFCYPNLSEIIFKRFMMDGKSSYLNLDINNI